MQEKQRKTVDKFWEAKFTNQFSEEPISNLWTVWYDTTEILTADFRFILLETSFYFNFFLSYPKPHFLHELLNSWWKPRPCMYDVRLTVVNKMCAEYSRKPMEPWKSYYLWDNRKASHFMTINSTSILLNFFNRYTPEQGITATNTQGITGCGKMELVSPSNWTNNFLSFLGFWPWSLISNFVFV